MSVKPGDDQLTLVRLYEELRRLGYEGGYDAVRRHARRWQRVEAGRTATAFVPLSFDPGEAYQFDWSHEVVVMASVTTTDKVAHVRLCHSRMFFVAAYPRETQEMAFDAHARPFAFFGGACVRGIYDNMTIAVDAVFVGKDRRFNRRSCRCATIIGCREPGRLVRERFFTPRLRFASYAEGTVRSFVREAGFRHQMTNRSPKITANWVLASNHSRGGRFHRPRHD